VAAAGRLAVPVRPWPALLRLWPALLRRWRVPRCRQGPRCRRCSGRRCNGPKCRHVRRCRCNAPRCRSRCSGPTWAACSRNGRISSGPTWAACRTCRGLRCRALPRGRCLRCSSGPAWRRVPAWEPCDPLEFPVLLRGWAAVSIVRAESVAGRPASPAVALQTVRRRPFPSLGSGPAGSAGLVSVLVGCDRVVLPRCPV